MKTLAAIVLLAVACIGCSTGSTIRLSWNPNVTTIYRATQEPFPGEMDVDVHAVLATPDVLAAKLAELRSLHLDQNKFPMLITLEGGPGDRINVVARNVTVTYATPAPNDQERRRRELERKMIGVVQLNTVIDQHGENLNPFLRAQQHNLIAMLFCLPRHHVAVGQRWEVPIILTSLDTSFLADNTRRVGEAWVNAISDVPGVGRVAEVVYVVGEDIEGLRQVVITEEPKPFRVSASYFAVGDYLLDEHRWLRYTGRLDTAVGAFRSVRLIALAPAIRSEQ